MSNPIYVFPRCACPAASWSFLSCLIDSPRQLSQLLQDKDCAQVWLAKVPSILSGRCQPSSQVKHSAGRQEASPPPRPRDYSEVLDYLTGQDLEDPRGSQFPLPPPGPVGDWSSSIGDEGPHTLILELISCTVFQTHFSKTVSHFIKFGHFKVLNLKPNKQTNKNSPQELSPIHSFSVSPQQLSTN